MHRTFLLIGVSVWLANSKDLPYSEETALKFANLAVAAYCGYPHSPTELVESWQCGPACDALPGMKSVQVVRSDDYYDDAFAYVGKLDDQCVLAFRGTTNVAGWILDLQAARNVDLNDFGINCYFHDEPCIVGLGWVRNYYNIQKHVLGNLSDIGCTPGSSITVTGHSLGAAEAGVAMVDLHNRGYKIEQTYTFGQPRIGENSFASAFTEAFGIQRVMRITHYYDPVPHLPPIGMSYRHVPQEIYYERDASDGYKICDGSSSDIGEDRSCADQFWNVPWMVTQCATGSCDHLTYMQPLLPYEMDGVSCATEVAIV